MNWKQHIGSTVLIRRNRITSPSLIEVKILETSPSGRVKFKGTDGREFWEEHDDYILVEVLKTRIEDFKG